MNYAIDTRKPRGRTAFIVGGVAALLLLALLFLLSPNTAKAAERNYIWLQNFGQSEVTLEVVGTPQWDGRIEYSTDLSYWYTWDGSAITSTDNQYHLLFLRGIRNTYITGPRANPRNGAFKVTGEAVVVGGSMQALLDYNGSTDAAPYAFKYLFYNNYDLRYTSGLEIDTKITRECCAGMFMNSGLVGKSESVPSDTIKLPATDLAERCYYAMFGNCTALAEAPELPATTLAEMCYGDMFNGCTGIKLSETKTAEYQIPYRIPAEGTGVIGTGSLSNMFANTGGTFTGTPEINKTYYLYGTLPNPTSTIPVYLTQEATSIDVTLSDNVIMTGAANDTEAVVSSLDVTNNLQAVGVKVTRIQANDTNANGYTLKDYADDFTAYQADSKFYALAQGGADVKPGVTKNDVIAALDTQTYPFTGKLSVATGNLSGIEIGNIVVTVGLDTAD